MNNLMTLLISIAFSDTNTTTQFNKMKIHYIVAIVLIAINQSSLYSKKKCVNKYNMYMYVMRGGLCFEQLFYGLCFF